MDSYVSQHLQNWGFADQIPRFKDELIDEEALLLLTEEMVRELFPKIGPRAKFFSKLQVLQQQASRKQQNIHQDQQGENSPVEPSASIIEPSAKVVEPTARVIEPLPRVVEPSARAIDPSTRVHQPSVWILEPSANQVTSIQGGYDIREILKRHPNGDAILKEHDEQKSLSCRNRRSLVSIVVDALIHRHGKHPNCSQKTELALALVEALPYLKTLGAPTPYAAYYVSAKNGNPAGGFLQHRITSIQRKNPERKKRGQYAQYNKSVKSLPGPSLNAERPNFFPALQYEVDEVSEAVVSGKKTWLKHNASPTELVREAMSLTRTARLSWIHGFEQPPIHAIIEEYPRLRDPIGYLWIDDDFAAQWPDQAENFNSRWEDIALKLLPKIQQDIRDPECKKLLEDLHTPVNVEFNMFEPSNEDIANVVLYLLPGLFPTQCLQNSNGSKRLKPSISDSMKAFIDVQRVGTNIDFYKMQWRAHYHELNLPLHPHVLIIGESVLNPSQCFVLLEDIEYEVDTIVKAVDTCFKMFYVLNVPYPAMASEPWMFIQKAVFELDTSFDRASSRMVEMLSFCISS